MLRLGPSLRTRDACYPPFDYRYFHHYSDFRLDCWLTRAAERRRVVAGCPGSFLAGRRMSSAQPAVAQPLQEAEQTESPLAPAERIAERTTAVAGAGVIFGALRAVLLNQPLKTPLALSTGTNAGLCVLSATLLVAVLSICVLL